MVSKKEIVVSEAILMVGKASPTDLLTSELEALILVKA